MRSEDPGRSMPGFGLFDDPSKERFIDPVDVFECVQHREARLDAQEDRGVAVADVQVDQEHIRLGGARQRAAGVHR